MTTCRRVRGLPGVLHLPRGGRGACTLPWCPQQRAAPRSGSIQAHSAGQLWLSDRRGQPTLFMRAAQQPARGTFLGRALTSGATLSIDRLLPWATMLEWLQNDEYFKKLPEPTEDELDMLDLAFGLTET